MKTLTRLLLTLCLFSIAAHAADLWSTDYAAALKKAAEDKKEILLDFTGSDWCGWCKRLDKELFSQPAFQEYAAKHLVLVTIDFPQQKEQSAALKHQNDTLQKQYHVEGFPTLVLLDSNGKLVKKPANYIEGGPAAFIKWVEEK